MEDPTFRELSGKRAGDYIAKNSGAVEEIFKRVNFSYKGIE